MSNPDGDPYESDDYLIPRSPRLKKIEENLTQTAPVPVSLPVSQLVERRKGKKKSNSRKYRGSQGDVVLLTFLDPNRPDLAQEGGNTVLKCSSSASESEESGSELDMEDLDTKMAAQINAKEEQDKERAEAAAAAAAKGALNLLPDDDQTPKPTARSTVDCPPDSMLPSASTWPTLNTSSGLNINGVKLHLNGIASTTEQLPSIQSAISSRPQAIPGRKFSLPSSYPSHVDSLITSPLSAHLRSPLSPNHRLPAIHDPSSPVIHSHPSSPQSHQTLPSVRPMIEYADKTNETNLRQRQQSFSSTSGPSPTLQYHSGAPSPFPPLNHVSPPTSLDSATSPRDFASRPGKLMASPPYIPYLHLNRRPSLATESYPPLHSASTTESYSSPDGFSPSTITTGTSNTTPSDRSTRMSVEGGRTPIFLPPTPGGPGSALNPSVGLPPLTSQSAGTSPTNLQLPPPSPAGGMGNGVDIQSVPLHGPAGGYKCEYEGCSAAPFQTQYLLNSHTTVHSQSRPHYCPVPHCPRSNTGKGFKRKNEMIRHGLVHESPGYVCPFCPDREHRYPRPDNLQRHVRVHHADVERADPRLREVLERRVGIGRGSGARRRNRAVGVRFNSAG